MKINLLLSEKDLENIENILLKERKEMFKDRTSNSYSEEEVEKLLQINTLLTKLNYSLSIARKNKEEYLYAKETQDFIW